jgi:hypothetical protein
MWFKNIVNATFKRWILNSDGAVSLTKIGLNVAGAGAAILAVPTLGLGIAVPAAILTAAKLACVIGGMLAGTGAKDTADKNADKVVVSNESK